LNFVEISLPPLTEDFFSSRIGVITTRDDLIAEVNTIGEKNAMNEGNVGEACTTVTGIVIDVAELASIRAGNGGGVELLDDKARKRHIQANVGP
jgi:hypothetical protein